jgi:acyl-CoA thioester hydrolase
MTFMAAQLSSVRRAVKAAETDKKRGAHMPDAEQRVTIRVYYEDTDSSGRVYHASYLRFFERGRTELLRSFGFQHNQLAASSGIAFAVNRLEVDFVAPAFIDDLLDVVTQLEPPRGAVLSFRQIISRDGATLASGAVNVVAIKGDRAVRPPRGLLHALAQVRRQ